MWHQFSAQSQTAVETVSDSSGVRDSRTCSTERTVVLAAQRRSAAVMLAVTLAGGITATLPLRVIFRPFYLTAEPALHITR